MEWVIWVVVALVVVLVLAVAARAARRSGDRPATDRSGSPGGSRTRAAPSRRPEPDDDEIGDSGPTGSPSPFPGGRTGAAGVDTPMPGEAGPPTAAAEVPGPVVRRPEPPAPPGLGRLLQGIALPCGLVPSTTADQPDPDRYLAVVTSEAAPSEVGRALGDELERLGFELFSLSEDEAVARKGNDVLSLRFHPDASVAQLAGLPLFPSAPQGAVGVEVWSGAGPNPRAS